jgi:hypothetical protein
MHVKDKTKSLPPNNMFYRIKSLIITCNRFYSDDNLENMIVAIVTET